MSGELKTYHYTLEQITPRPGAQNFRGPVREKDWEDMGMMLVFDLFEQGIKTCVMVIGYKRSEPRDTAEGREIDYEMCTQRPLKIVMEQWRQLDLRQYSPDMD